MKTIEFDDALISAAVTKRLVAYAKISTPSDAKGTGTPSTECQWDLARALESELKGIGIKDVTVTDHCYVIARIAATPGKEIAPVIAFMAHMDTVADVPATGVKPTVITDYDGKPITLAGGITLDPKADPTLAAQKGGTIVVTDGTTLLGSDDKAGVAAIVTAADYLVHHADIPHGPLEFIFTPDEEIGASLHCFPKDKVKAIAAYTLDGEGGTNLEIESFNAYAVTVDFQGIAIHPGHGRGILVSAVLMAAQFACMLPRNESPEATDGYYGYYCVTKSTGTHEHATMELLVRDFERRGIVRRLKALDDFADAVEAQFPGGTVTVTSEFTYSNMLAGINKNPRVFRVLGKAADHLGVNYVVNPIRGGTDGSALTEMGIPTPNIFSGGHNFHSRSEWASVDEMALAAKMVMETARLWSRI
jgi:tripeptide aminopeptidase